MNFYCCMLTSRHCTMASIRVFVFLLVTVIQLKLVWAQSPCRPDWRGDGFCDSGCNTKQYGFDDGDCCEETCKSKHRQYQCGLFGYECSIANPASTEPPTTPSTQLPTQPPTPSVPLWFVTQTEICYKWRADGDTGQCGHAPSEPCARVGDITKYYRDKTDERPGGCRMQWGIRSPAAPDWFRDNVQVCYQWYADGDGGQCGGGADQILCAGVGNFTAEYRDDTDNRGGGCWMSWMLSVPVDSPQWLRDVQLCFHWYAQGTYGQCGGPGVGHKLCARANSWTIFYRDNTESRNLGSCRMAWQIRL